MDVEKRDCTDTREDICPKGGLHYYQCVYEGWESETYQCSKCGDRYKLYDDEMR